MKKVRVLVIDDSSLVRKLLTRLLQSDPSIDVVGTAPDPYVAREKIKQLEPDVLTLDVEMPRMDGITFLRNLMRLHPMPVVMLSAHTGAGAAATLEALELGAIDFVRKPTGDVAHDLELYTEEIITKVKAAATARVDTSGTETVPGHHRARKRTRPNSTPVRTGGVFSAESLIAIGASTGGTEAIKDVLQALPAACPGVLVVQHIPAAFSGPFANRLNSISDLTVVEAEDGAKILPGHAYIAPGGRHLEVERDQRGYRCRLSDESPVNRHKPSVDVLFESVASRAGRHAVGVLLTGMGCDGAQGMKRLQEMGAPTIAQDEPSSVVWGMPGAAVKIGAADDVLALHEIAEAILTLSAPRHGKRSA